MENSTWNSKISRLINMQHTFTDLIKTKEMLLFIFDQKTNPIAHNEVIRLSMERKKKLKSILKQKVTS